MEVSWMYSFFIISTHSQHLTSYFILLFMAIILPWAIWGTQRIRHYYSRNIQDMTRPSIHKYNVFWSHLIHLSLSPLCCTSFLGRFYSYFITLPGDTWYFSFSNVSIRMYTPAIGVLKNYPVLIKMLNCTKSLLI